MRLGLFTVTASAACVTLCACVHSPVSRAAPQTHPLSLESKSNRRSRGTCAPAGPEVCLDGRDNNCNGLVEEGCGVATGAIQFLVVWNRPELDVDLLVVDPSGAAAEVGSISWAGLLKERDCPGKGEPGCKGEAIENVVLVASRQPIAGEYRVEVSVEPPPLDEVIVVLSGRLGELLINEEFSLSASVPSQRFRWSLRDEK